MGIMDARKRLFFVVFLDLVYGLFNGHVMKLFGVKDFATLQALDELSVFVPGDNSHSGVFAGACHRDRIQMKL
jgi:hypothetical protein